MLKKTTVTFMVCALFLCVSQARADVSGDTAVFTGATGYVAPNVLIIFDRSGSMRDELPAPAYDYTKDYSSTASCTDCPYVKNTVYRKTQVEVCETRCYYDWRRRREVCYEDCHYETQWVALTDISNIVCETARDKLRGYTASGTAVANPGFYDGRISATTFQCSSTYATQNLRLGNYMNFLQSPAATTITKIQAAKDAVRTLLETIRERNRLSGETDAQAEARMRFGLMAFRSDSRGGYLACPLGASYDTIISTVNGFAAETWTPLGETLAEAGLYFAGASSWANPGTTYTSPIQYSCQQNYIIMLTDGWSTEDKGDGNGTNIFTRTNYINEVSISKWPDSPRDYDRDGLDPGSYSSNGSHWMDDVAAFLYKEDLIPGMEGTQNVKTYTIGFSANPGDIDIKLMKSTAANGNGDTGLPCSTDACPEKVWQDRYILAENSAQLTQALTQMVTDIGARNETFIAPVVPVSKTSGTYSGYGLYLGLFQPQNEAGWYGNLKKYGLASSGDVTMGDGVRLATDEDGYFLEEAISCWYGVKDGYDVVKGGAGKWLYDNYASRTFYTRSSGTSLISFHKDTTAITPDLFGFDATDTASRDDLIDFIRAEGSYIPGTDGNHRKWLLGDIIHSKPATLHSIDNTYIFVGSNDGFLHCFVDDDNGTRASVENIADDTISEAWCFTPWDLLPKLRGTKTDFDLDGHDYLVDGSPTAYQYGSGMQVTFGLRRGGSKYYTLNVGTVDPTAGYQYATPSYRWDIGPTVGSLGETLGQSWSKPIAGNLKTSATTSVKALILGGGYDSYYEDNNYDISGYPATYTTSPVGRAIYAVNADTGALMTNLAITPSSLTGLSHCIIDLLAFDKNDNTYVDTIYAGNLGGQIIAARDWDSASGSEDGSWNSHILFTAPHSHTATNRTLLKFQYAPDVALEAGYDYVYIGTGDREHPNIPSSATSSDITIERFYAIQNNWTGSTLTESNLIDVSDYNYGSYVFNDPDNPKKGWFIRFNERTGEKVVSQPVVFNKVVYFTTYTPPSSGATSDPCMSPELGEGRVYALKYQTGEAFWNDTSNDVKDAEGNTVTVVKNRDDRWGGVVLKGLPTQPTIIVTKEGPKLVVASSGALTTQAIEGAKQVNKYYWRQR